MALGALTCLRLFTAVWLLFALISLVNGDAVLDLQTKGRPNLDAQLANSKTCTKDKLSVRREW